MKNAGLGLVLVLAACGGGGGSSTTDGGVTPDGAAATDGSVAIDGATAIDGSSVDAATGPGCGTGVTFTNASVKIYPRQNTGGAGILVTASSCSAGMNLGTTDATGHFGAAMVAGGTPVFITSSGGGHLSGVTAEFNLPVGTSSSGGGIGVEFDETFASMLYPDHDASHAEVNVAMSGTQAAGPCMTRDGWVVAVTGHPEAHVQYTAASGTALASGANATSTAGSAYISMVTPGAPAVLTATKSGCTMSFTIAGQTGKVPLVANAITFIAGAAQ